MSVSVILLIPYLKSIPLKVRPEVEVTASSTDVIKKAGLRFIPSRFGGGCEDADGAHVLASVASGG